MRFGVFFPRNNVETFPALGTLLMDRNPLNVDLSDYLTPLCNLDNLFTLSCSECGLTGELTSNAYRLDVWYAFSPTEDNFVFDEVRFINLLTLKLDGNGITSVADIGGDVYNPAGFPFLLRTVDISNNPTLEGGLDDGFAQFLFLNARNTSLSMFPLPPFLEYLDASRVRSTPDGRFSCSSIATTDSTKLIALPIGFDNFTSCQCDEGSAGIVYSPPGTPIKGCEQCLAGKYSNKDVGLSSCTACGPGRYQPVVGQVRCDACPRGRYGEEGEADCRLCPPNTFSDQAGASKEGCLACPSGTVSPQGSVSCNACPRGTYANLTLAACPPCPANTFAASPLSTSCEPCQMGETAPSGSFDCDGCGPGQYFSTESEGIRCKSCAAGRFNTGASGIKIDSCDSAQPGFYVGNTGANFQTPCPAGTFSANNDTVACKACGPGTYSGEPGMSQCRSCSAGFVSNQPVNIFCVRCGLLEVAPKNASNVCEPCPPFSSAGENRTQCLCLPNYVPVYASGNSSGNALLTECRFSCGDADEEFCAALGREPCTDEDNGRPGECGKALPGYVIEDGAIGNVPALLQCSAAPRCAPLNRLPCGQETSKESNTCGPCLEGYSDAGERRESRNTQCNGVDSQGYETLALVALLTILGAGISAVARSKSPTGDFTMSFKISLKVADVATDLQYTRYLFELADVGRLDAAYGIICLAIMLQTLVMNIGLSIRSQLGLFQDAKFLESVTEHKAVYSLAIIASLFNPELFGLVKSRLFGHKAFSFALPVEHRERLHYYGIAPLVFQDVPQLFLQMLVANQLGGKIGILTILTMFITAIMVLYGVLSRFVHRKARSYQDKLADKANNEGLERNDESGNDLGIKLITLNEVETTGSVQ